MPLTFDLPLEDLYKYTGINPRPEDFDTFWDNALEEMRKTDPDVKLIKSDFNPGFAECFDLYFTGVRGARIHAKYVKPAVTSPPGPALLQFHGYTMNSGDWYDKLPYAAAGFHVFSLDCRGQGGKSEDPGGIIGTTMSGHIIRGINDKPENLLFRQIFLDTVQLARIAMDMDTVDENRVGAFGGSQGGALTLACAALVPEIKGLVPRYPFLSDYKRVWEIDLSKDAYLELSSYFRTHDPMHLREEEIFTKLGYIDIQHLAGRIRGKVLMAVGLMDQICPPSTQFAAYNKIKSLKKLAVYPDYGHETLPGMDDMTFQFFQELFL